MQVLDLSKTCSGHYCHFRSVECGLFQQEMKYVVSGRKSQQLITRWKQYQIYIV